VTYNHLIHTLAAAACICAGAPTFAAPVANANGYMQNILVGSFGSVSQTNVGARATDSDGGTLRFGSSASHSLFVPGSPVFGTPGMSLLATASNDAMDGTLHARAEASTCGNVTTCRGHSSTNGASTAYWETLSLENGSKPAAIPMSLRVDGFARNSAYSAVRYFVGNSHIDLSYFNWQPSSGWHYMAVGPGQKDFDLRFDLGTWDMLEGLDVFVFVELYAVAGNNSFGDAIADFGHTARFNWTVPEGTRIRSASGQFMTGAPVATVPEPASWALSLLGLAVVVGSARSRAWRHREA
jgi:hypothetical protein